MNVCITADFKLIINEKRAQLRPNSIILGEEVPRGKTDTFEREQTSQADFRGRDREGRPIEN